MISDGQDEEEETIHQMAYNWNNSNKFGGKFIWLSDEPMVIFVVVVVFARICKQRWKKILCEILTPIHAQFKKRKQIDFKIVGTPKRKQKPHSSVFNVIKFIFEWNLRTFHICIYNL